MEKAMAGLIEDHQVILDALKLLADILDGLHNEGRPSNEDLGSFLEYLQSYIDDNHHLKEESILFPGMISKGVTDRGGPVGTMMAEHIQARGYMQSMIEELEEEGDQVRFEQNGRNYLNLMSTHIRKESEIIFPLAEKVFTHFDLEDMLIRIKAYDQRLQGKEKRVLLDHELGKLSEKIKENGSVTFFKAAS